MTKSSVKTGAATPTLDFILDTPATQDDLSAHGRVATAIADVVSGYSHIKMIGLIGGWGSGKSTVVQLVKNDLSARAGQQIMCFTYDAWLRQSDPPRRAFLEALLGFIEANALPHFAPRLEAWRKVLAELNGGSETVTTSATVEISKTGRLMVPALLLLPIGLKFIGDGTLSVQDQHDRGAIAFFLAGWLLAATPILAILFLLATRNTWSSIVSLLTNKPGEVKRELKTRNPEPTAIEFQSIFHDIVKAVHAAGRHLVIVLDNLDRLPRKDALAIWATMRSFFLDANDRPNGLSRHDLPVVIMPIDASAPGRIYGGEGESIEDGALSQSFIDKTFDLVFHVPPPVLSGWQAYLKSRLGVVFGAEMKPDWGFAVGSIYEAFVRRAPTRLHTTPRSLNTFVNALGVLWLQWRDEQMSIASIAYFVCDRESIQKDIYVATRAEFAGIEGFDADWQVSIAALHFGVPRDRASELYMSNPIRDAIANQDDATFAKLSAVAGFDRYFDRLLDEPPGSVSPTAAARAFARSNVPPEEPWVEASWRKLRRLALTSMRQGPARAGDDEALRALIGSLPTAEQPAFIQGLARLWEPSDAGNVAMQSEPLAALFTMLVEQSRAAGLDDFRIGLPANAHAYASLLAQDLSRTVAASLSPTDLAPSDIVAHLAQLLRSDATAAQIAAKAIGAYVHVAPSDLSWSEVFDAIFPLFQGAGVPLLHPAGGALVALLPKVHEAYQRLIGIRDNGFLNRALGASWNFESEALVVDLVALQLHAESTFDPPDGRGWDAAIAEHPELARQVDERLAALRPNEDFLWLVQQLRARPGEAPLLRAIAGSRLSRRNLEEELPSLYSDIPGYLQLFPAAVNAQLWRRLSLQDGLWPTVASHSVNDVGAIYTTVLGVEADEASTRALRERLEALPSSEWDAAIIHSGYPYHFLHELQPLRDDRLRFDGALTSQLQALAPNLLSHAEPGQRTRWFELSEWLPLASQRDLMRHVRLLIISGSPLGDVLQLLSIMGSALIDGADADAHPDAFVRRLAPEVLSLPGGPEWMLNHLAQTNVWARSSSKATQAQLRSQLQSLVQNGSAPAATLLATWLPERSPPQ